MRVQESMIVYSLILLLAANVLQADINNNHLFGNTRALSPTGTMTIISAICGVKLLRVYSNEIYNNTNPGAGLFNGIVPNNTSGVEARIYNNLIHDNLNGNAQFLGINELSGGPGRHVEIHVWKQHLGEYVRWPDDGPELCIRYKQLLLWQQNL